jgi:NAD+ diphosphatase
MLLPAFSLNPLVRHSVEHPTDALDCHRTDPATAHLLVAGDIPILRSGEPGTALLKAADLSRVGELFEGVFLGTFEGRPVVATLASPAAADLYREDAAFTVTDLRSIAVRGLVRPEELGLVATAKSILDWHRRHRFCAACGTRTAPAQSGFRRDCDSCGAQHFPRTDPVAIMVVSDGARCLLGQSRGRLSRTGTYSALAGFIDQGESIEEAVRREVQEEAGIQVGQVRYHSSQPWPFPSSLMIGCHANALTTDIHIDDGEMTDVRWFSRDEVLAALTGEHPDLHVPAPIAIAHHLIKAWAEGEVRMD